MRQARLGERTLFPELEWEVYLNHCGISPTPLPVRAAVEQIMADYARRGAAAYATWLARREGLRGKLGRLLGCTGDRVAFLPNTTSAVTAVATCFPWERGDRVVLFAGEFPTNVTPWLRAAELFGLEPVWLRVADFLRDAEEALGELERVLRAGARLVAVSAVQFQNGYRMPLERMAELCRRHGARLFVDAIQAAGVVPLEAARWGVDFLAAGSHKWMMAQEGAGFLYLGEDILTPRLAGWLSHEQPLTFLKQGAGHLCYDRPIRSDPTFLEGGSPNAIGYAALEAAVDLVLEIGVEAVYGHVQAYLDSLEPRLVALGFTSLRRSEGRSGILGLVPPPGVDLKALVAELARRGLTCSMPDGLLRMGPSWPNALREVDRVVEAVAESLPAAGIA